ncbi:hypothetical protein SPRG_11439 [Saprolegnia parasitica CBS 223.65]|uniref:Uncharacterized protein n=1 Tax=Saprolegnia parasitica (strain CBS 223.65) TaxID=695850 RepID=A0A067C9L7_SAPPC|nr:hypothetical protein SPRG_11439 [Saprolegnia parasitica CBS 223.65]KDO23517.1 hypothetical protein SPRG_11439 [Saprolegnia parasitica CBS 223.65]|eukprot:XP_012205830.1 hypothetical protein SPRG_11439 [Saprolegnia parasitica CBS 223.65]
MLRVVFLLAALATCCIADTDDRAALRARVKAWKESGPGQEAQARGLASGLEATDIDAELDAFQETLDMVATLNAQYPQARFSEQNPFALMTQAAFEKWVRGNKPARNETWSRTSTEDATVLPASTATTSIDWSTSGCMAPVRNQGVCGSCFAYAAVAAAESAYCLVNNRQLTLFSDQQALSCGPGNGCYGGWSDLSLGWMAANGMCTLDAYPNTNEWTMTTAACEKNCAPTKMPFTTVASTVGEVELEQALNLQPVAVDIGSSSPVFKNYAGGVITGGCDTWFDHVLLGVGYGNDDAGLPYFKMKNSWGTWWGENGYVRLQRGVGGVGTCGLARHAAYPVVFTPQFNLVTSSGHVLSEYYSNLFAGPSRGPSPNEQWNYDSRTHHIKVNSNHECLDAYYDGSAFKVHTYTCDASNGNQRWRIDSANHRIAHRTHPNLCLDVDPSQNNKVQVWACGNPAPNQWLAVSEERVKLYSFNNRFLSSNGEMIQFPPEGSYPYEWVVSNADNTWRARSNTGDPQRCLDAYQPWNGGVVHLYACDATNANQKWRYDPSTKQLRHLTHLGFCLDMRTADGSQAHLWRCNAPTNDLQRFTYASQSFP